MRAYREDNQRIVRLHGYYVRRPQAAPASRGATWRDALEALAGVLILLTLWVGVALWGSVLR